MSAIEKFHCIIRLMSPLTAKRLYELAGGMSHRNCSHRGPRLTTRHSTDYAPTVVYLFCRLLSAFQTLAENIPVQKNETLIVVKENIAMGVKIINPKQSPGLLIQAMSTNHSNVNLLSFSSVQNYTRERNDVAAIYLPSLLFGNSKTSTNSTRRITTFVFDNEKLFLSNMQTYSKLLEKQNTSKMVNSKILSVSIKGVSLTNLTEDEQVTITFSPLLATKGRTDCVFWDFSGAGMFMDHYYRGEQVFIL